MGGSVSTVYEARGLPEITPLPKHVYEAKGFPEITYGSSMRRSPLPLPSPLPTKKPQVMAFHSSSKWKLHFEASKQTSKLMVIDFTATWCGPCQHILPTINEFAEKYADVEFVKIDVDELDDVAQEFGVQAMPTFILIKRGKEVDKVVGAKRDDLQKKIEKHRF